jgi:hypothetical protein
MAKLALINREDKRRKIGEEVSPRSAPNLKAIINDVKRDDAERMDARLKLAIPAPRRQREPAAQPLPADRSPARRVPQVRAVPQHDPR